MAKSLGLVSEGCGNGFGKAWRTELTLGNGEVSSYGGQRPEQFFGVHALVKWRDEYLLLEEKDGVFRTIASLTLGGVTALRGVIDSLVGDFSFSKKSRYFTEVTIRNESDFLWERPHAMFPVKVLPRAGYTPLIEVMVKGKRLAFDAAFLLTLSKVLDI